MCVSSRFLALLAVLACIGPRPACVSAADPQPRFQTNRPVELLGYVDVAKNSLRGAWTMQGAELVSPKIYDAFLEIPIKPPKAYELTVEGRRESGVDLFIGLPVDDRRVAVVIDAFNREWSGLSCVDDQFVNRNETGRFFKNLLGDGKVYRVVCTVHPGSIIVTVNGTPAVTWVGDSKRLSLPSHWRLADSDKFFIGGWDAVHKVRKITLKPLAEDHDIAVAERKRRIVKLVHQQPSATPELGAPLGINWAPADLWPLAVTQGTTFCTKDFLFAYGPARIVFQLPPGGTRRFTAVGYCARAPVRFSVYAAEQPSFANMPGNKVRRVCETEPARVVQIDEPLQPGDRYLMLQTQDERLATFWLHPSIQRGKKAVPLRPDDFRGVEVAQNKKNEHFGMSALPPWAVPALEVDQETPCDEFLYARAPSELRYPIPSDAQRFSAIGYCLTSGDVEFEVRVDNRPAPIFKSGKTPLAPIDVEIPSGATELALVVNDLGNRGEDFSFWLYPRFRVKPTPKRAQK